MNRMKLSSMIPWLALLAFAAGCQQPTAEPVNPEPKPIAKQDAPKETPPPATTPSEPEKEPAKSSPEKKDDKAAKSEQPTKAPAVPAALQHEGYEYYGLGNDAERPMTMTDSRSADVRSGTQRVELKEMTKDYAIYVVKRTGDLAALGETELKVTKSGIYAVKQAGKAVNPSQMELPASIKPGAKWTANAAFELPNGGKVSQKSNPKIVGPQKVKTKAGEFPAMLVVIDGSATINGQNMKMDSKIWFVKGVGPVKMEVHSDDGKGSKTTLTVEATS